MHRALLALCLLLGCGGPDSAPPEEAGRAELEASPVQAAAPPALARSLRRVVVDAGHGGEDLGAVGVSGVQEKDITLSIALALGRCLRERDFEVVMTRTEDVALPLARRSALGNASGGGLFVSIHANSAPSDQAHGIETYSMALASDEAAARLAERENRSVAVAGRVEPEGGIDALLAELRMGAVSGRSAELADGLHARLVAGLKDFYGGDRVRDRGTRTAPFWVLVDSEIPAVLVEVGYLTHSEEERRLRTRGFHRQVAEALAQGIEEFVARVEGVEEDLAPAP